MATLTIEIGTELIRGDCYTLNFTIQNLAPYTYSNTIDISIGATFATSTALVSAGANPLVDTDYSIDFDYPLTGDLFQNLYIVGEVSGANISYNKISNLDIVLQEACADTYCSECYQLEECNDNFMLIQWTNDNNGLGFNYDQLGFIQQTRLKGGIRVPSGTYDDETFYTTSKGQRGLQYTQVTKQEELWIHAIPEYLHDAIRVALAHDHFFIDNVEYVKAEGGYNPDWDVPLTLKAPVAIPIQEKTQNTFNQNC